MHEVMMRISSKATRKCKEYLLLVSLHQEHPLEHSTLSCFPCALARKIHLPPNSPEYSGLLKRELTMAVLFFPSLPLQFARAS